MKAVSFYQSAFSSYLQEEIKVQEPKNLYEPISYILNIGGKRLRPVMVLMAAEVFGTSHKKALDAALAIEVFHNFSLMHDDIMDAAPIRRGKESVHEKWNINTAILSGDAMLINAYQLFENYQGATFRELATLFTKTAIKVCEGQQYDVDFETIEKVSLEEYIKMIRCKTAVLVGAALEMGAIIAGAQEDAKKIIYDYGVNLGIAFQLQDDYLDAFGDPESFGKQVGGDIIENKKTFLYLKAIEKSSAQEAAQLEHLYTITPADATEKIETVKSIFESSGAATLAKAEIERYTAKAFEVLKQLEIEENKKEMLLQFGNSLMTRTV
ncbi:polyprenyl synthetase family protein [Haloflavibacter putidus]|uniref:Polyprenyl synthetase family protein n=1 Tax=Haloflavibacter putidus TaxID=2576776 RepID=A0A508A0H8_9FLAO|nr:polyprenyl synthetase family protein [Haloflavibacter putidus]TQD40445.1 polyprenyl synthetase family protein [Haloflavibacter putidus]